MTLVSNRRRQNNNGDQKKSRDDDDNGFKSPTHFLRWRYVVVMSTNTAAVSVLIYPTFIASMNVEPNDLKITKVFHTLVSNGFNIKNKYYYGNN